MEKEALIQEVDRTNLLTLTSGHVTITIDVPAEKMLDVLYLLDCWQPDSLTQETDPIRIKALFKYRDSE